VSLKSIAGSYAAAAPRRLISSCFHRRALDVLLGGEPERLRGTDPGGRGGHWQFGRARGERPRGVVRVGPRQLGGHVHVDELVLDRLERRDGPAERKASHRVLPRHVERGLRAAHLLERHQHGGAVQQRAHEAPSVPGGAERLGESAVEHDRCVRAGRVDGFHGGALHARRVQIHQRERERAIAGTVRGTCGDDREVRHVAVGDRRLRTADLSVLQPRADAFRGRGGGALGKREAPDRLPERQRWQPGLLLRIAAREQERLGGEIHARRKRRGGEATSQLFRDHAKLEIAEPGAAIRLGDRGALPAVLRHAAPELDVVGRVRLEDAPDPRGGSLLSEEFLRLIAQDFLVVGEVEVHG
jgi:hypothetical protein